LGEISDDWSMEVDLMKWSFGKGRNTWPGLGSVSQCNQRNLRDPKLPPFEWFPDVERIGVRAFVKVIVNMDLSLDIPLNVVVFATGSRMRETEELNKCTSLGPHGLFVFTSFGCFCHIFLLYLFVFVHFSFFRFIFSNSFRHHQCILPIWLDSTFRSSSSPDLFVNDSRIPDVVRSNDSLEPNRRWLFHGLHSALQSDPANVTAQEGRNASQTIDDVLPGTIITDRFVSQQAPFRWVSILNLFQMKSTKMICNMQSILNKGFEHDGEL
jgi:hypothetical protein